MLHAATFPLLRERAHQKLWNVFKHDVDDGHKLRFFRPITRTHLGKKRRSWWKTARFYSPQKTIKKFTTQKCVTFFRPQKCVSNYAMAKNWAASLTTLEAAGKKNVHRNNFSICYTFYAAAIARRREQKFPILCYVRDDGWSSPNSLETSRTERRKSLVLGAKKSGAVVMVFCYLSLRNKSKWKIVIDPIHWTLI